MHSAAGGGGGQDCGSALAEGSTSWAGGCAAGVGWIGATGWGAGWDGAAGATGTIAAGWTGATGWCWSLGDAPSGEPASGESAVVLLRWESERATLGAGVVGTCPGIAGAALGSDWFASCGVVAG